MIIVRVKQDDSYTPFEEVRLEHGDDFTVDRINGLLEVKDKAGNRIALFAQWTYVVNAGTWGSEVDESRGRSAAIVYTGPRAVPEDGR